MAFTVLAYPGAVEIPRWDRVAVTEGSGLGVADTVAISGSDPEWGELLMSTYDRVAVLEDLGPERVAYGPYDIVPVDISGEHRGWSVRGVKNYYWEQQLADTDRSAQESVLAEVAGALCSLCRVPALLSMGRRPPDLHPQPAGRRRAGCHRLGRAGERGGALGVHDVQ